MKTVETGTGKFPSPASEDSEGDNLVESHAVDDDIATSGGDTTIGSSKESDVPPNESTKDIQFFIPHTHFFL